MRGIRSAPGCWRTRRVSPSGGRLRMRTPISVAGAERLVTRWTGRARAAGSEFRGPREAGSAAASFGSPSGAPPFTQPVMSPISSCVSEFSSRNSPKPLTAFHGGIERAPTASRTATAQGRTSEKEVSEKAPPPGQWQFMQRCWKTRLISRFQVRGVVIGSCAKASEAARCPVVRNLDRSDARDRGIRTPEKKGTIPYDGGRMWSRKL